MHVHCNFLNNEIMFCGSIKCGGRGDTHISDHREIKWTKQPLYFLATIEVAVKQHYLSNIRVSSLINNVQYSHFHSHSTMGAQPSWKPGHDDSPCQHRPEKHMVFKVAKSDTSKGYTQRHCTCLVGVPWTGLSIPFAWKLWIALMPTACPSSTLIIGPGEWRSEPRGDFLRKRFPACCGSVAELNKTICSVFWKPGTEACSVDPYPKDLLSGFGIRFSQGYEGIIQAKHVWYEMLSTVNTQ